jgi:hypothetical protein
MQSRNGFTEPGLNMRPMGVRREPKMTDGELMEGTRMKAPAKKYGAGPSFYNEEEGESMMLWNRLAYVGLFLVIVIAGVIFISFQSKWLFNQAAPHIPVVNDPSYTYQLADGTFHKIVNGVPTTIGARPATNTTFGASVCQLFAGFAGVTCTTDTLLFDRYEPWFSYVITTNSLGALIPELVDSKSALPIQFTSYLAFLWITFVALAAFIASVAYTNSKESTERGMQPFVNHSILQLWMTSLSMNPFRLFGLLGFDTLIGLIMASLAKYDQTTAAQAVIMFGVTSILYTVNDFTLGVAGSNYLSTAMYSTRPTMRSNWTLNSLIISIVIFTFEMVKTIMLVGACRNNWRTSADWDNLEVNFTAGASGAVYGLILSVSLVDLIIGWAVSFGAFSTRLEVREKEGTNLKITIANTDEASHNRYLQFADITLWVRALIKMMLVFFFMMSIVTISSGQGITA